MKPLTVSEKFGIIREHGERLSRVNLSFSNHRSEIIESAQRIIELVKSIPKVHFSSED